MEVSANAAVPYSEGDDSVAKTFKSLSEAPPRPNGSGAALGNGLPQNKPRAKFINNTDELSAESRSGVAPGEQFDGSPFVVELVGADALTLSEFGSTAGTVAFTFLIFGMAVIKPPAEFADIVEADDVRPVPGENPPAEGIDFTLEDEFAAGPFESQVHAADAAEETAEPHDASRFACVSNHQQAMAQAENRSVPLQP